MLDSLIYLQKLSGKSLATHDPIRFDKNKE